MKLGAKADIAASQEDRILRMIAAAKREPPKSVLRLPAATAVSHRLEPALAFARRGWSVLPCWWAVDGRCACGRSNCSRVGKHPLSRLVYTGEKEATTDAAQITGWWKDKPFANIGIATGPSRLVVLDIDPRHGGEKSLLELTGGVSARDLSRQTHAVQTPGTGDRRGYHLYFAAGTSTFKSRTRLRPGIDVRADTGYVIAPPSIGANGDYVCVTECDPAPVPSWLRAELLKSGKAEIVPFNATGDDWVTTTLRGVPEGGRNDACTKLAGYFLRNGTPPEAVEIILNGFAERCSPPMPEAEVQTVVRSIDGAEAAKRASTFVEISEPLSAFAERVAALPTRRMLIEHFLPWGTGLIHGQPRAKKSFAVLDCLVAVATGTPAFGVPEFTTNDPFPVWYITDEDSEVNVWKRLDGLCRGRSIPHPTENFQISVWKGLSLDTPDGQSRIIETVRRHNIQVLVIDPLRSVTTNADQGPAEFAVIAQFLRRLRRETHDPSIWLVHHDTKPTRDGRESRQRQHRVSGGAILAFCEFSIHMEGDRERASLARVTPEVYKFMPSPAPFEFTLDASADGAFHLVGNLDGSAGKKRSNSVRERIVQVVRDNPYQSANEIAKIVKGNKQSVLAEIKALGAEEVLVYEDSGERKGWIVARDPVAT